MTKHFKFLAVACLVAVASGCSHTHQVEGPQPKVEIPAGVIVEIGGKEVKEGEVIEVMKPSCRVTVGGRGQKRKDCYSIKAGTARVLKVIDDRSAVVEPLDGLKMDKTMSVEKID
jgi:hypothetical protein